MKRFVLFLMIAIAAISSVSAQNKEHKPGLRQELKEFKMKFLAQEMDLKEDQQVKFFELYSQMENEKEKLRRDTKALEKKVKEGKDLTDDEYRKANQALTEYKEKEAEIEKKYDEQFSKFLSQKQISIMKTAEEKFRVKTHEMRDKFRKNKKKS